MSESALWLARLYRLRNEHDKAEEVLRGILKERLRKRAGHRATHAAFLDEGKSAEAIALLESM